MLAGKTMQECVELAAAHGALLHTTRGDTSQVTLEELLHVAGGGSAEIRR
jgi:2-dehydro-3-deoxygluconokinase